MRLVQTHTRLSTREGFKQVKAGRCIGSVGSGKQHALGEASHHLARFQVRDNRGEFADQIFRFLVSSNAGEDVARFFFTDINRELKQFAALFDFLAVQDLADSEVDLGEVVKSDIRSQGFEDEFFGFGFCLLLFFGRLGSSLRCLRAQFEELLNLFFINTLHEVLEGVDRFVGR